MMAFPLSVGRVNEFKRFTTAIQVLGRVFSKCINFMLSVAVFTRDTLTGGKCHFTIENVMQYNRNVNLPQVNVSRVNTACAKSRFYFH